jgi:drug/metabolite transporter (DMT)-like permease
MIPIPFFGEICGLLTAFFWSGSSIVFSAATVRVGSMLVNISRLALALCCLIPILVFVGFDAHLSHSQLLLLGSSGIIGLAIGDSFLFRAYRHIGARVAMLVMSASPAISALLAYWILDEETSVLGILGMLVTLTGIVIVVNERRIGPSHANTGITSGVLYAFLSAIAQGVSLILAKLAFLEGSINGFVAAAVRIATAFVVLLPLVAILGRLAHPFRTFAHDRKALGLTVLGSVLGPFLGISTSLMAVANTQVGVAATLMSTVPIIMLPLVRIIFKERLTGAAVGGAFVAVAGVALLFLH